uniref:WD repeat-containing protein 65 n=1 Tax=Sipha flava TaxID=143950 RepID=A0A2S2R5C2_9HEMI
MPMFMTCGRVDRTVKLWDYQQCELLLTERYAEDVLDVSLHPSGLYALVAFARSVTFNVVSRTDGLVPRRTFGAEDCRGTRFSGSGHMFAVTDGTSVDVYCSVTFAKCFKLNGHQSAITDLVWAANDWKLYTCDGDGGLCRFNLYTDQHITDMVFRGQSICGLAVSDNLKEIYTVAQDSSVREIYGRMVIRNKDLNHGSLNGIILFKSNKMLLVAGQYGVILSLPLPLKSKINYKEFYIHNKTILKMRLSTDDASLITCSADDSICIWRVKNSNFFHTNTTFMENTLVSFNFLKNKIDRTKELELKLEKLTKKKERDKLKLIKNQEMWLKVVHDQYALDMKRIENEKKEILAMFHADKARLENEISTLKENHERDWITSKENYEKQLSYEDDKYEQLIKDASNSDADFKK